MLTAKQKKLVFITGFLVFAVMAVVGWQITSAEIGNIELHDDLKDIAAQNGVNIGLNSPKSDDQIRADVVNSAAEHGIHLQLEQVKLERIDTPFHLHYDLDVSYTRRVNLLLCSFDLHFKQTSAQ